MDPATERRTTGGAPPRVRRPDDDHVAHRLSTAEHADRVFVFDAGRLVEEGTHEELRGGAGSYARLYESWLGNVRVS